MGAELTSPCTWVKHLPTLLRNKANSQKPPSVYEDRRPKSTEDTEKTEGKELLQDKKVPGTNTGTRVAAAPGPPARGGPAAGLLGESQVKGPLLCQTRPEQHCERPGCLKSQGGE